MSGRDESERVLNALVTSEYCVLRSLRVHSLVQSSSTTLDEA